LAVQSCHWQWDEGEGRERERRRRRREGGRREEEEEREGEGGEERFWSMLTAIGALENGRKPFFCLALPRKP